MYFQYNRRN